MRCIYFKASNSETPNTLETIGGTLNKSQQAAMEHILFDKGYWATAYGGNICVEVDDYNDYLNVRHIITGIKRDLHIR